MLWFKLGENGDIISYTKGVTECITMQKQSYISPLKSMNLEFRKVHFYFRFCSETSKPAGNWARNELESLIDLVSAFLHSVKTKQPKNLTTTLCSNIVGWSPWTGNVWFAHW